MKKLLVSLLTMSLLIAAAPFVVGAFVASDLVQVVSGSQTVDFGDTTVNQTKTMTVRVKNNTNRTLRVLYTDLPSYPFELDAINTDTVLAPSATGDIVFNLRSSITGLYTDRAILSFVDNDLPTNASNSVYEDLSFVLIGNLKTGSINNGNFTQSRSSVNFGDKTVNTNTNYTERVTFNNTYDRTLTFVVTDGTSLPFSYRLNNAGSGNGVYFVGANSSFSVDFAFAPTSVSTRTETFTIRTDATDNNRSYSVNLTGRGVNGSNSTEDTENLLTNFKVYADSNLYYNQPRAYLTAEFYLNEEADLDLRVYETGLTNSNRTLVERVFSDRRFSARTRLQTYNFELARALDPNKTYSFELSGESVGTVKHTDIDTYFIGRTVNPINPGGNYGCAGFSDVDPNSQFCDAVEYVVSEGIFTGDDLYGYNGAKTLRPNDPLVRAEAVAVMLRAVDAGESTTYPVPFYDVNERDWYVPLLREAVRLGAINGFPDGTFKPAQNMTRAEFYKAFLRLVDSKGRGSFFLNYQVNYRPFKDVTLAAVNRWYLPYVDFARRYFDQSDFAARQFGSRQLGGIYGQEPNGYFKPDEAITRGHIIELIHETHLRNIISY